MLTLVLVISTFTAGVAARPAASGTAVFNVGFSGDPPVARGDTFHGGTVLSVNHVIDFAVVRGDTASFPTQARGDPRVSYVEVDQAVIRPDLVPNDPDFSQQWGWGATPGIDAVDAWDATTGSTNVVVAVLDTGYDSNHPDLPAPYLPYNAVDGSTDASPVGGPCDGHGTHTAGTVAALTNNGVGVAGAAQVSLMPVKVFTKQGGCTASFSAIANGITYATNHGADIISMSLGCTGCSSTTLDQAIQYATTQGVLVVAAAGNSGPCSNCVGYPASNPNVMAVAAVDSSGNIASFSSSGPQVNVAAPGVGILSTLPGGTYGSYSGTSMATPHVAGIAALLLSYDGSLTRQQLWNDIVNSAVDLGASAAKQGSGAANACLALVAAGSSVTCNTASGGGGGGGGGGAGGGGSGAMHVASIAMVLKGPNLHSSVTVADGSGNPLQGVTVSATICAGSSDCGGSGYQFQGTTGSSGSVQFNLIHAGSGTWTTCVDSLQLSGYTWDAANDANRCVTAKV